jgi:uncharacterized membrane protein
LAEIIVLRLVHVLGGLFWVGTGLFSAIFLIPAMSDAGPAAGAIMGGLQRRRMFVVLPIVAVLTILSGVRLMWLTSGGFAPGYFTSGRGATFTVAAVAAIVAFALGLTIGRPMAARLAAVGESLRIAGDAETKARLGGEMSRLQRRNMLLNRVTGVLLIIAAAGMAVGRYVP